MNQALQWPQHHWWRLGITCCIVALLIPVLPITAQEFPHLRGYQPGLSFSEVGGTRLPCQEVYDQLRCDAAANIQLWFERDTLIGVRVTFDIRPVGARDRWFAVSDSLIALYGEPDSVRVKSRTDATGTTLTAYWTPLTSSKPWGFTYTAMDFRYGVRVASTALMLLDVCLWHDQGSVCADVIEQSGAVRPP